MPLDTPVLRRRRQGTIADPFNVYASNSFKPPLVADFSADTPFYSYADPVLGPELVTNGDFETGDFTGWSNSQDWTTGDGRASLISNLGSSQLTADYTAPALRKSLMTFDVVAHTSGRLTVRGNAGAFPILLGEINAVGSYSLILPAGTIPTFIRQAETFNGSIDNVSVKAIISFDGVVSDFETVLTPVTTSLATTTDIDGLRKWNAHNFLLHSENFTDATWVKNDTTVQGNVGLAPDGTTTADRVIPTAASAQHKVTQNLAVGGTFVGGVWAKAAGYDWILLQHSGGYAWFDVANGVVGTVVDVPGATITPADNGYYLCKLDPDVGVGSGGSVNIWVVNANGATTITGDGTSGVDMWGAQLNEASLGGMVDNPHAAAGFETYVKTTTAIKYLSRLNSYYWNGSAFVKGGLRLEYAAATNLTLLSNDFSTGVWLKVSVTQTPASAVGADGAASLTKIAIADTANIEHFLYPSASYTVTTNVSHCTSFDLRNEDQRYVSLRHYRGVDNWSVVVVDLQAGVVTDEQTGATSGTILLSALEDLGGGLYRLHFVSNEAGTLLFPLIQAVSGPTPTLSNTGSEAYVGVAGVSFYMGAVQTVVGALLPSYTPTNGSPSVRDAETIAVVGPKTPANPEAVSIAINGLMSYVDDSVGVVVDGETGAVVPVSWRASASDYIFLAMSTNAAATGDFFALQEVGGVSDFSTQATTLYTQGVNVAFNLASAHTLGRVQLAIDGVLQGENATPTALPDVYATDLRIGTTFNGFISKVRVWGIDIVDAGLSAAATP